MLTPDAGDRAEGPEQIAEEISIRLATARRNRDLTVKLGRYRGCYLTVEFGYRKNGPPILTGEIRAAYWEKHGHPVSLTGGWTPKTGPAAVLTQIDAAINDAAGRADACLAKAAECRDRAKQLKPYLDQQWDGQEELAAALKKRAELEQDIDAQVKDSAKQPVPAPA